MRRNSHHSFRCISNQSNKNHFTKPNICLDHINHGALWCDNIDRLADLRLYSRLMPFNGKRVVISSCLSFRGFYQMLSYTWTCIINYAIEYYATAIGVIMGIDFDMWFRCRISPLDWILVDSQSIESHNSIERDLVALIANRAKQGW